MSFICGRNHSYVSKVTCAHSLGLTKDRPVLTMFNWWFQKLIEDAIQWLASYSSSECSLKRILSYSIVYTLNALVVASILSIIFNFKLPMLNRFLQLYWVLHLNNYGTTIVFNNKLVYIFTLQSILLIHENNIQQNGMHLSLPCLHTAFEYSAENLNMKIPIWSKMSDSEFSDIFIVLFIVNVQ